MTSTGWIFFCYHFTQGKDYKKAPEKSSILTVRITEKNHRKTTVHISKKSENEMPDNTQTTDEKIKILKALITKPDFSDEDALKFLEELELDNITQYFWTYDERTENAYSVMEIAIDELAELADILHEEEFKPPLRYPPIRVPDTSGLTSNLNTIHYRFAELRPAVFRLLQQIIQRKFKVVIEIPPACKNKILSVLWQQPLLWHLGLLACFPGHGLIRQEKEEIANNLGLRVRNYIRLRRLIGQVMQQETLLLCHWYRLLDSPSGKLPKDFEQKISRIRSVLVTEMANLDECADIMLFDFHSMIPELQGLEFSLSWSLNLFDEAEYALNDLLSRWASIK